MALQGNLEDLPLLDIIQIVSFSKKTGYLSIEMEGGAGAIVFLEGLVVSAFTATSPPADPRLGSLPKEAREKAARGRIGFALEQLADKTLIRYAAFGCSVLDSGQQILRQAHVESRRLGRKLKPDRTHPAQVVPRQVRAVHQRFSGPVTPHDGQLLPGNAGLLSHA